MQQLLTDNEIKAVIGENISSSTLAMVPIIDRRGVILISPSASTPKLTGKSKYFFRVFPSDVGEGAFIADKVYEQHPDGKVCIMYYNNDYGLGLTDVFRKEADKIGLKILEIFPYAQDEADFKTILTKVKQQKPDAVYIAGYYRDAGNILKQSKEFNIEASFWGATTMEDPQLLTIAGEAAEGFKYPVSTGYDPNDNSNEVQEFIKLFQEQYKKDPGLVAALGYDCAKLLIDAIKTKEYSPDKIREFFLELKNYPGAAGKMTFDENGDVHKPIVLKVIEDGEFRNLN